MKNLFTTTAIVMALGLPGLALAQTTAETAPMGADAGAMPGFMASRGMADLLATDLIGHAVYARRTAAEMTANDGTMSTMAAADLDNMDNIGEINDLVLSADGSVQAIVIGVGGFIGVGEQDVAVTMDQVRFTTDTANPDDMYIVVNTTGDLFKTSPAFNRTAAMQDMATGTDATAANTTAADGTMAADSTVAADGTTAAERARLTAPMLERDGYTPLTMGDISIDTLIGKTVYGANDGNVGTVEDVIVDDAGAAQEVIIDFGGFLGMGTTQVALSFDELTILTNEGNQDIRVYVDATKEQVQSMPVYTPLN